MSFTISVPINSNAEVDLESQATSLDQFVPPFRITESGNGGTNGFMLILDGSETESLSQNLRVIISSSISMIMFN